MEILSSEDLPERWLPEKEVRVRGDVPVKKNLRLDQSILIPQSPT